MWPAVERQERPQTAFDMRQVQRELDEHADQLEMQTRINTAENLPLGPHEWQHDHAGKYFPRSSVQVGIQLYQYRQKLHTLHVRAVHHECGFDRIMKVTWFHIGKQYQADLHPCSPSLICFSTAMILSRH